MTTLNPVGSKPNQILKPQFLHNYTKPISSLSFKTPFHHSSFSIKASSSQNLNEKNPQKPQNPQTQNPFSFLKPTVIATVTATALLFTRFLVSPKPTISAPVPSPPTTTSESLEESEEDIQQRLVSNPDDVDALRKLMEIKIKDKKLLEAISVIDKLIAVEPDETEWPLLKSHLYINIGEVELAKVGFNEILQKDPFKVAAYHGLVMAASQDDNVEELKEIEKKVEEGMKKCKKEKKDGDLRDFKLLLAQIRVIEGRYDDALKVYQELVKEEPRDFRPYLCQGIIYTLLRKSSEAEKCFEKYRRLVPQGHPYARYFDDNMMATKVFAQKMENERAGSSS